MVRVLVLANSSWNLQHFRSGVIRELLRRGHSVTTVSPDSDGIKVDACPVRHRQCRMHRSSTNLLSECRTLYSVFRALLEEKPDVALLFTIKPNIYGSAMSRFMRFAAIPNVSGLGTSFLGSSRTRKIVMLLYKFAFSGAAKVFFQNGDDRSLFINSRMVRADQATIIPGSGVNLSEFQPAPLPNAPRFLMIARILGDKGVREYLEAATLVKRLTPTASFSLIGELDPANPTALSEKQFHAALQGGAVNYLGSSPDVRPFIREASAIVLPSYREGLPRSLLEGAAMGRPLIGSDVPGCREVVRPDITGFLCEARSINSLAAAMERMARISHDHRARLGANARRMVEEEFDEEFVVQAYAHAIEDLCTR